TSVLLTGEFETVPGAPGVRLLTPLHMVEPMKEGSGMRTKSARRMREALLGIGFLFAASGLTAQGRLTVPEGSVIIVRTSSPIQSASAQVGQTFQTTVIDPVNLDGYTVIPAGSMIRGVMTFVQPASGNRAGVIEVNF